MSQSPIAVAADYADAMLTARRAKNVLVGLLLAILLLQLALFFATRFSAGFRSVVLMAPETAAQVVVPAAAATQPADEATPAPVSTRTLLLRQLLEYLVALQDFAGIVCVLVLSVVLLLILQIMLVGRLIGVRLVTAAFIWSVVLMMVLFPWLAIGSTPSLMTANFKFPGVLYTWGELTSEAGFQAANIWVAILKWTRWVAAPIVAIILLLIVHLKSRRGLQMALGEIPVELSYRNGPESPETPA